MAISDNSGPIKYILLQVITELSLNENNTIIFQLFIKSKEKLMPQMLCTLWKSKFSRAVHRIDQPHYIFSIVGDITLWLKLSLQFQYYGMKTKWSWN